MTIGFQFKKNLTYPNPLGFPRNSEKVEYYFSLQDEKAAEMKYVNILFVMGRHRY
jgi:hypothetical protein